MTKNQRIESIKRIGTGLSFILFPVIFAIGFAVHPNLLSFNIVTDASDWVQEFHGNNLLHLVHVTELFCVPLIIVIVLKFKDLLQDRGEWYGLIGCSLAVFGATILAADKGALCMVPSAFETLPDEQFTQMLPGLQAMLDGKGMLALRWVVLLLPIGTAIQGVGLFVTRVIPRWQSILLIIGSLMLVNPDIDLINLFASIFFMIGMIPIGIQIIKNRTPTST